MLASTSSINNGLYRRIPGSGQIVANGCRTGINGQNCEAFLLDPHPVPELGSLALFVTGLVGLGLLRRRKFDASENPPPNGERFRRGSK